MNLQPEIKLFQEKKLTGFSTQMSLVNNKTVELWQSFMLRRKELTNTISNNLYSIQVYDAQYNFIHFNPAASYTKWACTEIANGSTIPEGMQQLTIPQGLYAVFYYKGSSANAPQVFGYIFGVWLAQSEYTLDLRPHFEVLGEKYKNNHPESEEEIWIPIKPK